jgi:hypothetical protein
MRLFQSACYLGVLSLGLAASALAEIYKTVDAQGRVVYTDVPSGKRLESVDLPHINETPATEIQPLPAREEAAAPVAFTVQLQAPVSGSTLLPGDRNLSVVAVTEPALGGGYVAELWLDGKPYGAPQEQAVFTVADISRGQHSVSVVVLDPAGNLVGQSPIATVNVIRPVAR